MDNVFLNILNMSITASYIAIAVILIRLLLRRAPKFISCVLWGLVALRLIFPFSFESIMSLIPSASPVPPDIIYSNSPAIQSGIPAVNTVINPIIQENFTPTVSSSVNPLQAVTFIAANIWVLGIIAMLTYCLISYLKIRKQVSSAVKDNGNVYLCDAVSSPFILGVIKPRIYLPSNITENDKVFVLAHETAHIKRLDHIWKPLGFLLLSVYWFNPVLWVAYILLCRDIELACDEHVIKKMGIEDKKLYSSTLLSLSITRRSIAACPVAFGEVGVKSRIKGVLNYKRPTFWITLIAVIACLAVSLTFLTNPLGLKIHRLEDAGDYSKIFENVTEINVKSDDVVYTLNSDKTISDVVKMLKKINLTEPINQNRSDNRSRMHTITINGDNIICFNADCTELWINNSVKPTLTYGIKNPDVPRKYFSSINTSKTLQSGSELDGVSITLEHSVIIDNGGYLSVTIKNNTSEQITCGDPFKMFYQKGDKFVEIPLKKNYAFHLLAYMISPAESLQKSYPLECYDLPKADVYRFETTVSDSSGKNYTVWINFKESARGEYNDDPAAVSGEIEGYRYFHATVTKMEYGNIYVRPFDNTNELEINEELYVSTRNLKNKPPLKIGAEIRILYDGKIDENKYINGTYKIYWIKDLLNNGYNDISGLQMQYSAYPADILSISFLPEQDSYVDLLKDYMANKTLTGNGSLPIFKFNSRAQIDAFIKACSENRDLHDPTHYYHFPLGEDFNNITKKYTDEFLKDNTVFIVEVIDGAMYSNHAITGLSVKDNVFCVQISHNIQEWANSAMDENLIIFSVPNGTIENCTEFNAVRGPDAYIPHEHGFVNYFKHKIDEHSSDLHSALSIEKRVELDNETYQELLNSLKNAKWIDDRIVDRLNFSFDGYIRCGYYVYFSFEQDVMYFDHYFCGIPDNVYELLKELQ